MTSTLESGFRWNSFEFSVYKTNSTRWYRVSGIYVFSEDSHLPLSGNWKPLYIGQASDLQERLKYHEKIPSAIELGLCVIHVASVSNQNSRDNLERALIQQYQPQLNVQLKTPRLPNLKTQSESLGLLGLGKNINALGIQSQNLGLQRKETPFLGLGVLMKNT